MDVAIPASIGRYQVVRPILQGGMGIVCLARDPAIGRPVAIKMLRESLDSPELRARFLREARSAGQLQHSNIVTIYDVGEDGGRPFIAMEYIEGQTLAQLVREPALPLVRKLELMEALCDGLHYAHQAGVVHRDIKPANLMVDRAGALKILDFGIARLGESDLTQTGEVVGTLNYMAPEQMDGAAVDHRADIFSVGAVFYELLTARRAFQGDRQSALIKSILYGEPEPLEQLSPGLDPRLASIVARCLAKSPADRYASMIELQAELTAVRRSVGAPAPQPEAPATLLYGDGRLSQEHTVLLKSWLRQARDEIDRGDLTQASVLVERALSMHGASPDAHALRRAIDDARRRGRPIAPSPPPAPPPLPEPGSGQERGPAFAATAPVPYVLWAGAAAVVIVAIGVAVFLVSRFAEPRSATPDEGRGPGAVVTSTTDAPRPDPPPRNTFDAPPTPTESDEKPAPPLPGAIDGLPDLKPVPALNPTPAPAPVPDDGVRARTLNPAAGASYSVSFSPSGGEVAAGSLRGVVSLWDVTTGRATQTLPGHVGGVWSIAFSPDGRHLAARSGDQTIRLWDVGAGRETARLAGHAGDVWSVAYSPDGRLLASASADGTVRIWDTASGSERETLSGHSGTVTSVAFTADGRRLVSGGKDGTVRLWDVGEAREVLALAGHTAGVLSVAVSRSGLVAAGAEDGFVRVWSIPAGASRWSARGHRDGAWAVAFRPDGAVLATGGGDGLVKTWKTESGGEDQSYTASDRVVRGVSYDARGRWLASASIDGIVHLWRQ